MIGSDSSYFVPPIEAFFRNHFPDYKERDLFAEWAFGPNFKKLLNGMQFLESWNQRHGKELLLSPCGYLREDTEEMVLLYRIHMKNIDIDTLFTYHATTGEDPKKFDEIRAEAKALGNLIIKHGKQPKDIEKSISKLRECIFYSIDSIVVPEVSE